LRWSVREREKERESHLDGRARVERRQRDGRERAEDGVVEGG